MDILCIRNLPQNIFDPSPTPGFWHNRLRNLIKISVTTPKPQNQKMNALSTLKFISMLQYSHSFEFLFIYFVPYKIGLKMLSGTFFRIGLSLLEAGIWRFLWCHLVGYSLYVSVGPLAHSCIFVHHPFLNNADDTSNWPDFFVFLVACYTTLHPTLSVHPSVGRSVTFLFSFMNSILWPHCSSSNGLVT